MAFSLSSPIFGAEVQAPDFKPTGLTGATQASRYVGATTSGAPASGTFAVGDLVIARNGHIWSCTAAGSPGTWVDVGAAGGLTSPLSSKGDIWAYSTTDARLGLGSDTQVLTADSTQALGVKWAAVAAGSLTTASNLLSGDVSMPSANTYYDGPSVSCAAGTWLLVGGAEVLLNTASQIAQAKLWDGTTTVAAGMGIVPTGAAGNTVHITLCAIVSPGSTTTYKISCAATSVSSGANSIKAALLYNNPGNYASHLFGVKVA